MSIAKAMVLFERLGEFKEKEIEVPQIDEKFILIRLNCTTTCGTDVHIWKGELPSPLPIILGHESVGILERAPENFRDSVGNQLKEGDRVIWSFVEPCYRCYVCNVEKLPSSCPKRKAYGINVGCETYPFLNGGYATHIVVGINTPILKVESTLDDEILSPISCAVSTVVYALSSVNIQPRDRTIVLGAGPLGLYTCAYLHERNVNKVIVLDYVEERLKMAEEFGAHKTFNLSYFNDNSALIKEISKEFSQDGATLVIEVAGNPAAIDLGTQMLAIGGKLLTIGAVVEGTSKFNTLQFIRKQASITGSLAYDTAGIYQGLLFIHQIADKYPLRKIVTKSYSLNDLGEALLDMGSKKIIKGAIKIKR